MTPVRWNKGTGLKILRDRRIAEEIMGREIEWTHEVEMRGDGFAVSNDRSMAEVFPEVSGIYLRSESIDKLPAKLGLYLRRTTV